MTTFLPLRPTAAALIAGLLIVSAGFAPAADSPTGGDKSTSSASQPNIALARSEIDAGKYRQALKTLAIVVKAEPRDADAWNLMGYASRKMKQYDNAARYYNTALTINPKHLGALEYQGELFVLTNQFDSAKANLAKLKSLCGNCGEMADLQEALSAAGQS